jgi:tRNA(Met) C34 N-acetyltransferase TmcA
MTSFMASSSTHLCGPRGRGKSRLAGVADNLINIINTNSISSNTILS